MVRNLEIRSLRESERFGMFHFQFFIVSKSGFVERIACSSENGKNLDISSGGVFAWERSNEMM